MVRNPMNYNQVSKVSLSPSAIDCIVFWTKDPVNVLDKLDMLSEYNFYFLITVTGYDNDIEWNVRPKEEIVRAFRDLANKIGKERTVWRYDPIILTDSIDAEYHFNRFGLLASQLESYTERCIISFVDVYKKCEKNLRNLNVRDIDEKGMLQIGKGLADIARSFSMEISACSELVDLSPVGIISSRCIDGRLISRIIGRDVSVRRIKTSGCLVCVESVDIGTYDTCRHGCVYCYANSNERVISRM